MRSDLVLPALVAGFVVVSMGCATPLRIKEFDIPEASIPSVVSSHVVSVDAIPLGRGRRVVPLAGPNVSVDEDEVGMAVASRMAEQLRQRGVTVEAGGSRVIAIQVVRVSLQPDRKIWCVIDFNRRLGGGRFFGFQSRAKSWSFEKACAAAVSQAVIDQLNDASTLAYLSE